MDIERFEEIVARAVEALPGEFRDRLENIDVVVEETPTARQLHFAGVRQGNTLLGLYEGVPQTRRSSGYGLVLPDKITLFRSVIESVCRNDDEIAVTIVSVVKHEIAHHFGISDARLDEIEKERGEG